MRQEIRSRSGPFVNDSPDFGVAEYDMALSPGPI